MKAFLLAIICLPSLICAAADAPGYLVLQIDRYTWKAANKDAKDMKQSFKIPVTDEFRANFKRLPAQNTSGTGLCCSGGDLTSMPGSTRFMWWLERTTDQRWHVHMWANGVEKVDDRPLNSRNPSVTQEATFKTLEELDLSYDLSYVNDYDSLGVSFSVKYVPAKDLAGSIPTLTVLRADRSCLFQGEATNAPIQLNGSFQEN